MAYEPELWQGSGSWQTAQRSFMRPVDTAKPEYSTTACWYDTSVDSNEGAFAMVQVGSSFEDLVGDFVQIVVGRLEPVRLYVVGGADLAEPFGIQRAAWLHVENLWRERINIRMRVLT